MDKKKYIVSMGTSPSELEDIVVAWMAQGYQPLGGVSTMYASGLIRFYQAMTLNYIPTAKDYENASKQAQR